MWLNNLGEWLPIGAGVVIVWLAVVTWLWIRANSHYRRLTQGITKKDLKTVLDGLVAKTGGLQEDLLKLRERQDVAETMAKLHLQRVGFVRFNPFTDTGGDQSFCLVLLDRHNSGIVISSLHSRDQTRIYAKRITQSKPEDGEFSKEEKKAFEAAQHT